MKLKKKLAAGKVVYGPFMISTDPAFSESAGFAGFDFIVLDMEHGPASLDQAQNMIRAAMISGTFPIVRTPPGNLHMIAAVQDLGAKGVLVPQVKSAEEASGIVNAARFYPEGYRGLNGAVRAAQYTNKDNQAYIEEANKNLLIIQLEGTEALENLDEILNVPGIDIFFIGPYDLSQALGFPGQIHHAKVIETMQAIIRKAKDKNLRVGTYAGSEEDALRWKNEGVQFLAYSMDIIIFMEAAKKILRKLPE